MDDEEEKLFGLIPPKSPEQRRDELISGLAELQLKPSDLAHKMERFGDDRSIKTILRSIDRMISGETKVSPEMSVIMCMLLRQHRRLNHYHQLTWNLNARGTHRAELSGWHVYLSPQSRDRWILSCSAGPSREDFSPPFGRWLGSLEEAKHKALVEIEEGMNELADIEHEHRVRG